MFYCEECGKLSKPGQKQHRKVVKRYGSSDVTSKIIEVKNSRGSKYEKKIEISLSGQIKKEVIVCAGCSHNKSNVAPVPERAPKVHDRADELMEEYFDNE